MGWWRGSKCVCVWGGGGVGGLYSRRATVILSNFVNSAF